MIDRGNGRIAVYRQCELLGIPRSTCYYKKVRNPEKEEFDSRVKALISEIYFDCSFYGKTEIFNTDQGSQFTGSDFTCILEEAGVTISMDGKGCALDNIYCERLWRTVKYEEIFLKSYDSVPHLRNELDKYFRFYDYKRGHSAHGYKTPWEVYSENSTFWKTGATA